MSEIMRADYMARLNVQLGKLGAEDLAYLDGWNIGSVMWLLREYEADRLMRDCDCEMEVALACEERDRALDKACRFIADYGSCPYDTFDLYEPWDESCYQKCSADIDRAECWRRYFERSGE